MSAPRKTGATTFEPEFIAALTQLFEERIPFNTLHDLPGMYRAFDTIRELASSPELVLPGHDPLVLERLKKVGNGIVEL